MAKGFPCHLHNNCIYTEFMLALNSYTEANAHMTVSMQNGSK